VTCLYSADWVACVRSVPHSLQNLAVVLDCAPQEPPNSPVAVSPPPPSWLGSTIPLTDKLDPTDTGMMRLQFRQIR
jgi:hypothetical protein